jgi:hypothetical protein
MRISKVSPSRLKTAKQCQFKYFLTYQWGWGDELFLYTFASEFGTSVHNTMEQYVLHHGKVDYKQEYLKQILDNKPFSKDMSAAPSKARASFFQDKTCQTCSHFDPKKSKCALLDRLTDQFEGCPRKLYDEGLVMVETAIDRYGKYFRTGFKSDENPDGKVIGVEAPAGITWGKDDDGNDIVMNGFIDLVIEYDAETLLIVDYKTGYSVPTHEDFLKDLQPRMYSYAAKLMYPDYKYYWVQFDYFRGIPMEHAFTAEDDEVTRREVVKIFNEVKGLRTIKRRAQDRICKYLCNRPFCNRKWDELKNGIDGSNPDYKPFQRNEATDGAGQ